MEDERHAGELYPPACGHRIRTLLQVPQYASIPHLNGGGVITNGCCQHARMVISCCTDQVQHGAQAMNDCLQASILESCMALQRKPQSHKRRGLCLDCALTQLGSACRRCRAGRACPCASSHTCMHMRLQPCA